MTGKECCGFCWSPNSGRGNPIAAAPRLARMTHYFASPPKGKASVSVPPHTGSTGTILNPKIQGGRPAQHFGRYPNARHTFVFELFTYGRIVFAICCSCVPLPFNDHTIA